MRTYALAIAFAAALFYPVPSSSQGIEIGPGGVYVDPDRDRYRDRDHYRDRNRYRRTRQDCKELRRACLHKDELGEQGEGNCQRYRETCGQ
jgi:hypothetical protein